MARLRINGLVRIADHVRQWLASGAPPAGKARAEGLARDAITFVERCAREAHTSIQTLPGPSLRALTFLRSIDFSAVSPATPHSASAADQRAPQKSGIRGLRPHWEAWLLRLSRPIDEAREPELRTGLEQTRARVDRLLCREERMEEGLSASGAEAVAWLRHFSQAAEFQRYCRAIRTFAAVADPVFANAGRFAAPVRYEFSLSGYAYRIGPGFEGTRVRLATSFVVLEADQQRELANELLTSRNGVTLRRLLTLPGCRALDDALHTLVRRHDATGGAFHDLSESFERVRARYFTPELPRPRLTWNRTLTGRKFGHFEPRRDTVMLSRTLDRADVPAFVVDFVMYHELLHKVLGVREANGRCTAHTPEFRAAERRFAQFDDAERWLSKLAHEA